MSLALFITHELDAIRRHEWRMMPLLDRLEDEVAHQVFTLAHVPLMAGFFWLLIHPSQDVRFGFQVGVDIFLMLHLGLHILLRKHEHNEFKTTFSNAIIGVMAVLGPIHLLGILGLR